MNYNVLYYCYANWRFQPLETSYVSKKIDPNHEIALPSVIMEMDIFYHLHGRHGCFVMAKPQVLACPVWHPDDSQLDISRSPSPECVHQYHQPVRLIVVGGQV